MTRLAFVLLSLSLTSAFSTGCMFYSDDDDDCAYYDRGAPDIAPYELRNPDTGQCEYFYDDTWCDSTCGPCPAYDVAIPSWGWCYSSCEGLDEDTCLDTSGCRAAYIDSCPPDADCDQSALLFHGCWSVDQTGPIQGECSGLGAWECSQHDDCVAVHDNSCGWASEVDPATCLGNFAWCMNESEQPDPGTCYGEVLCDVVEPNCPTDSVPGIKDGCYTGYCIPLSECEPPPACSTLTDEAACTARDDCAGLYEGVDCTCDANGCDCADWVFDSCEDA